VTASKIAPGQVVKALNGLSDNVQLVAGSNITLTPAGNTLTISGTGQDGTASQQPFQITNVFSSGDGSALTQFEVPQGKRLVIENVSANATTDGGRPECAFILTTIINGGQPSFHYFPANFSQLSSMVQGSFSLVKLRKSTRRDWWTSTFETLALQELGRRHNFWISSRLVKAALMD
jgi:hypothetical protein